MYFFIKTFWSFFFLIFVLSFLSSFLFFETSTSFESLVSPLFGTWFSVNFILDKISILFISMVSSVSSVVFLYSLFYMMKEPKTRGFQALLGFFVFSMIGLSLSGSLFSALVFWDLLGLSSFCLVIFYQSWCSLKGGFVTFLLNRLGDLFFLLLIWIFFSEGQSLGKNKSFFILLVICGCSKSAQFPFSSWLPMAMAAPTPVSSLVHSSTLVTAGVFLVFRFKDLGSFQTWELSLLSFLTIIFAGTSALGENDLKKIIALSTLSHLGFMFLFISFRFFEVAMFHMIMHAFFKSGLFMVSGALIHGSESFQDLRKVKFYQKTLLEKLVFILSILSMCGLPFLSGFFSKELMLFSASGSKESIIFLILFFLSASITMVYSFRILAFCSSPSISGSSEQKGEGESFYSPLLISGSAMILVSSVFPWQSWFLPSGEEEKEFVAFLKLFLLSLMILSSVLGSLIKAPLKPVSLVSWFLYPFFLKSSEFGLFFSWIKKSKSEDLAEFFMAFSLKSKKGSLKFFFFEAWSNVLVWLVFMTMSLGFVFPFS